jgi:hypothetical protein
MMSPHVSARGKRKLCRLGPLPKRGPGQHLATLRRHLRRQPLLRGRGGWLGGFDGGRSTAIVKEAIVAAVTMIAKMATKVTPVKEAATVKKATEEATAVKAAEEATTKVAVEEVVAKTVADKATAMKAAEEAVTYLMADEATTMKAATEAAAVAPPDSSGGGGPDAHSGRSGLLEILGLE